MEQTKGVEVVEGTEIPARILDVDLEKDIADLTLQPALVSAGANAAKPLKTGKTAKATIELVKEDYIVVSLPKGHLGFAATKTVNDTWSPFERFATGAECEVTVVKSVKNGSRQLLVSCADIDVAPKKRKNTTSASAAVAAAAAAPGSVAAAKAATAAVLNEAQRGAILKGTVSSVRSTQLNLDFSSGAKVRCDGRRSLLLSASRRRFRCSLLTLPGLSPRCLPPNATSHTYFPTTNTTSQTQTQCNTQYTTTQSQQPQS